MPITATRRQFLNAVSLASAGALIRVPQVLAAEEALETTAVRLLKFPGICIAPQYAAEQLLRAEGFTDVRYVDWEPNLSLSVKVGRGDADFSLDFAGQSIQAIDSGAAITILGRVHVGCYELFAKDEIRSVGDLKNRTIGIRTGGANPHVYLTAMAAHIGVDPTHDIRWVTSADGPNPFNLFINGEIDAYLAIPPEPQELRARGIRHVVLNSIVDRPWSQYFCCMLAGNREFVTANTVATKRVLRAIVKAADLCVSQPALIARQIVDRGFADNYDFALQSLGAIPYDKWREYDPEDTVRFYALRLHEVGFIKSTPQKIIADGTDWRFLDEVKRELKA
jgi:NitT/TauT family transport system substrate-binding protein